MYRSIFLVLCAISCTFADTSCRIAHDNDCSPSQMTGPTLVYPGGKTRCVFDDKKEYYFQVRPGFGVNRNKIFYYFQGSGGCFDKYSCSRRGGEWMQNNMGFPIYWKHPALTPAYGILNATEVTNPLRGWTVILIPTCTGDSNAGQNVVQNEAEPVHHNGGENTLSAITYGRRHIPKVDRVLVAGCSSGALGVQVWTNRIVHEFNHRGLYPDITIMADSFTGFLPEPQAARTVQRWGSCEFDLKWRPDLQQKCREGKFNFPEYMEYTIRSNPKVSFLFVYSLYDLAERGFYCMLKRGITIWALRCISYRYLHQGIFSLLQRYNAIGHNNVASYSHQGDAHCMMQTGLFNEARSGGMLLRDWVAQVSDYHTGKTIETKCPGQCPPQIINNRVIINSDRPKRTSHPAEATVEVSPRGGIWGKANPATMSTPDVPVPREVSMEIEQRQVSLSTSSSAKCSWGVVAFMTLVLLSTWL